MKSEISPYTLDDLRKLPRNSVERLFARARYKEWLKKERQNDRRELIKKIRKIYTFKKRKLFLFHRALLVLDKYLHLTYTNYIREGELRESITFEDRRNGYGKQRNNRT